LLEGFDLTIAETWESMAAMRQSDDEKLMRIALAEAARGVGMTSPNPAVGAVIVSASGRVLAKGYHSQAGAAHAEIEALTSLGRRPPRGARMVVTLEPCSTEGRTGACTAAIIASGIKTVVVGVRDPNPAHGGRGLRVLRKAGVTVRSGVLAKDCRDLNRGFNKWITTGVPWVIAKAGMSADGRITRPAGEGQWLTGREARQDVQRLRARVDAIVVGAGTVRADDPRLTVRGIRGARQPWRVVLARESHLPRGAKLFSDNQRHRTLIYRRLALVEVLQALGRRDVTSVLIEGGSQVHGEAFAAGLVDEVVLYYAPIFCGGEGLPLLDGVLTDGSVRLVETEMTALGRDFRLRGLVKK